MLVSYWGIHVVNWDWMIPGILSYGKRHAVSPQAPRRPCPGQCRPRVSGVSQVGGQGGGKRGRQWAGDVR